MQAVNITTNMKLKIDFTLLEFSATKTVKWNFHVGELALGRYIMILFGDLLDLLQLKISTFL